MDEWERQLRYCIRSEGSDDNKATHRCNLLVINDPREINAIKQRAKMILQPTEGTATIAKGKVTGSARSYELFTLLSYQEQPITPETMKRIYNGRLVKDEKLADRTTGDSLANYVTNFMNGPPK